MGRPTFFISDLHLPAGPSPLREAFLRFLEGPAREAGALYILGDLFETWIGDDVGLVVHAAEAAALRALVDAGVPVWFQHGNRDFVLGPAFFAATGVALLPDPVRIELHGTPTLLSHGDLWCTDDQAYQRWRRVSRHPLPQAIYRRLPVALRERIAGNLRGRSAVKLRRDPSMILDVNPGAITRAFRRSGVPRIIHGHTHRPQTHHEVVDGAACERIVLADWAPGHIELLRVDERGAERVRLAPPLAG